MILTAPAPATLQESYLAVALQYVVIALVGLWLWRRLRRPRPDGPGDIPLVVPPVHPSFTPARPPAAPRGRVHRATPSPVVPPGLAWVLDYDRTRATCPACRHAYPLVLVLQRAVDAARRLPLGHSLDTLPVTCPGCDYEAQAHVSTPTQETPNDAR